MAHRGDSGLCLHLANQKGTRVQRTQDLCSSHSHDLLPGHSLMMTIIDDEGASWTANAGFEQQHWVNPLEIMDYLHAVHVSNTAETSVLR